MEVVRNQSGATLVEAVSSLAIAVTLMSLAVPSMQQLLAQQRLTNAVNIMVGHIHYTRLEAVKRVSYVTLCPSINNQDCSNDYLNWHKGVIIFVDDDEDGRRDNGEQILRVIHPFHSDINIYSTTGRRRIKFRPVGTAYGSNVTITLTSSTYNVHIKQLKLSNHGRLKTLTIESN